MTEPLLGLSAVLLHLVWQGAFVAIAAFLALRIPKRALRRDRRDALWTASEELVQPWLLRQQSEGLYREA